MARPAQDREVTVSTSPEADWLARERERRDQLDYRRSLYTNTKPDHPGDDLTGQPCRCQKGDDTAWERHGIAMKVLWPPQAGVSDRTPQAREPQRKRARGRSR
jgi:hypothetical protein